jgi:hypothetical protein
MYGHKKVMYVGSRCKLLTLARPIVRESMRCNYCTRLEMMYSFFLLALQITSPRDSKERIPPDSDITFSYCHLLISSSLG